MEALRQILYRSMSRVAVTDRVLLDIQAASARNNPGRRISGFLLYRSGLFVQYLEGPAPTVEYTLSRVIRDGRHHDLVMLADEISSTRLVGSWHMMVMNMEGMGPVSDQLLTPLSPMLRAMLSMPSLRRPEHRKLLERVERIRDGLEGAVEARRAG